MGFSSSALLLVLLLAGACCPGPRVVYEPLALRPVERPGAPVLVPLDPEQHLCTPEQLERLLGNLLELGLAVRLRDAALDVYEAQTQVESQ